MTIYTDSENMLRKPDGSDAPDPFRKEIGSYRLFTPNENVTVKSFRSGKINNFFMTTSETEGLIPKTKATIFLSGEASSFRGYSQWANYIQSTIKLNNVFLDHTFGIYSPNITNNLTLNKHIPDYENYTKIYDTNELINYNLVAYPHKNKREDVARIGDLQTIYADQNSEINSSAGLEKVLTSFEQRRKNYKGTTAEIIGRQRNIFKLVEIENSIIKNSFPFVNTIRFNPSGLSVQQTDFYKEMVDTKKLKNIYQMIKDDLSFSNREFTTGETQVSVKIYDFIRLITSFNMTEFSQKNNELFLFPEEELMSDTRTDRFENKINTIKFFKQVREKIKLKSRTFSEIIDSTQSKSYPIGYKVEKYLRTRNQSPIQTYYTNTNVIHDTQMKFGREYIYVVKQLRLIVGSAYKYTNLVIPHTTTDLSDDDLVMQTNPAEMADFYSSDFKAYVEVEIVPSIQIAEVEVGTVRSTFIDKSSFPPEIYFYNEKNKSKVSILLKPGLFKVAVGPDQVPVMPDYFYGKYEIFRKTTQPSSLEEMLNHRRAIVDRFTTTSHNSGTNTIQNDMKAHFFDDVVANKKYYYSFRSISFHNTPSNLTPVYEVELLKDSDEYKINVKEFIFKEEKNYRTSMSMKRLIKISPNAERIFFSRDRKIDDYEIGTEGVKLCEEGAEKTFKIRAKSKHTGKMIDFNITFKIINNTQNPLGVSSSVPNIN